jgi:hypothetical protein
MRKNHKIIVTLLVLLISSFALFACKPNEESGSPSPSDTPVLISDYSIPENFAITFQMNDCALNNPGNPWYFKTAKIGNDWQIIEYNRDLADMTKQETHFFKYLSEDSYTHYTYDYTSSSWTSSGSVSFKEMIAVNPANFAFLYNKPTNANIEISESSTTYDVDPTSAVTLISAKRYEYTSYFDIEVMVDIVNTSICLYKNEMDGSLEIISNRAYEYSTSIEDWSSPYMSYRQYKAIP